MEYKYDRLFTLQNKLFPYFGKSINDLAKKDGGKGLFPEDSVAISLDEVEKSKKKAAQEKTMDITIGISKGKIPDSMLLCEFRFNYKNPKNINKTEISDKVNHSKDLLTAYGTRVYSEKYFLFSDNVFQQAKSWFNRLFPNKKFEYFVSTENDFCSKFFST